MNVFLPIFIQFHCVSEHVIEGVEVASGWVIAFCRLNNKSLPKLGMIKIYDAACHMTFCGFILFETFFFNPLEVF